MESGALRPLPFPSGMRFKRRLRMQSAREIRVRKAPKGHLRAMRFPSERKMKRKPHQVKSQSAGYAIELP